MRNRSFVAIVNDRLNVLILKKYPKLSKTGTALRSSIGGMAIFLYDNVKLHLVIISRED